MNKASVPPPKATQKRLNRIKYRFWAKKLLEGLVQLCVALTIAIVVWVLLILLLV